MRLKYVIVSGQLSALSHAFRAGIHILQQLAGLLYLFQGVQEPCLGVGKNATTITLFNMMVVLNGAKLKQDGSVLVESLETQRYQSVGLPI